jgi:predicted histidine transporter YuiF (NhaC family)
MITKIISALLIIGWLSGLLIGLVRVYKKEKEYEIYK